MTRLSSTSCLALLACFLLAACLFAQTAAPAEAPNAADLYLQAAKLIVAHSPSETADTFSEYPPYGPKWDQMAQTAFEKNAPALELARRARSVDQATWAVNNTDLPAQLGASRSLMNEIADAAEYQHFHGDDAGAFESIQDILHLGSMLRYQEPRHEFFRPLASGGGDAMAGARIMVIAPDLHLTSDPADVHDLQINTVGQVIGLLLDQTNAVADVVGAGKPLPASDPQLQHINEIICRANAERTFAAMSLAAQLFRFDQHRWPNSLDELVPAYLPTKSIDPWGDGAQTFEYVLIKAGLPDGGDRPLVYDRCNSGDGLFYRIDAPQYWYYSLDGSDRPAAAQKHGGQFRDLADWRPATKALPGPTTRPLP